LKSLLKIFSSSIWVTISFSIAFCFFFAFSSFTNFNKYSQPDCWAIKQTPTTNNLFSCSFPDNLNGWAVGAWGTIIHTADGGNTWVLQNDSLQYPFVSVSFINNNTGWITGNTNLYSNPVIISTTNAGLNWHYFNYPDTSKIFKSICFADSLNGYIGTYSGVIIKTTNGGNNWFEIQCDSNFVSHFAINKFAFYNNKNGVAAGGAMDIAGFIKKTTNFGYNWITQPVAGEPLNDIRYVDSNYLIGIGGDFEYGSFLYKSTNSGTNYSIEYFPTFGLAYAVAPRTKSEYWISMGFTGKLLLTQDSGNSFSEIPSPGNSSIYDIVFKDTLNGWCVGTGGMVGKYNNSSVGISEGNTTVTNKSFNLYQNYPNPFNPRTKIKFDVIHPGSVKIIVYDIMGREIQTLVNKKLQSGTYETFFDGSLLTSGIYFYKLITDRFTETKKMLLMK
jgi:photosystem II stability/assembly factor-like uncharacterized protein